MVHLTFAGDDPDASAGELFDLMTSLLNMHERFLASNYEACCYERFWRNEEGGQTHFTTRAHLLLRLHRQHTFPLLGGWAPSWLLVAHMPYRKYQPNRLLMTSTWYPGSFF